MKQFLLAAVLLFSTTLWASGDHTPDYCSEAFPEVCAHLGHMSAFSTQEPAQFVAHAMVPGAEALENFQVSIWHLQGEEWALSPSSHSLSPKGTNKYLVQNVQFSFEGDSIVKLSFLRNGRVGHIDIPVIVSH